MCPFKYTPGGAGRFIPLTIRRCISVLLRSENILWKEKDKKADSSHHQLIHCQTRMPRVFVRAFSTVHSCRDHLHKIQQSKGRAQTELKISLRPGTKPTRQQDWGRSTEKGGMAEVTEYKRGSWRHFENKRISKRRPRTTSLYLSCWEYPFRNAEPNPGCHPSLLEPTFL